MLRPWQTQLWLEDSSGKTLHSKLLNTLTADIKEGRADARQHVAWVPRFSRATRR